MKKIAYILTSYPCPSETFIQREITQLRRQGLDISVFAATGRIGESMSRQDEAVYYRISLFSCRAIWSILLMTIRCPLRLIKLTTLIARFLWVCPKEGLMLLANLSTVCFFAKIMQGREIEHIHAGFLSWPACMACGVSILTRRPYSIAAHARDIFVEGGAVQLKVQKAHFITCCTRQGLEFLKKNLNSTCHPKLLLNYHGIEPKRFPKNVTYPGKDPFIIAVGRLVEKKGFTCLLEAFSQVLRKRPDVVLVIAGEGPQKGHLKHTAERLGIQNQIYLTGWLEQARILDLISQSKMLVVPSMIDRDGDRDGLPNVILEAFSVRTPVIASNLAGIGEAVVHEKTGILVKSGDFVQLAKAIERLLDDDRLGGLLAANAAKTLAEKFNLQKNGRVLATLFRQKNSRSKGKIAHIIEGFLGGTSTYLCHVLAGLTEAGFDVTLICSLKRCDCKATEKINRLRKQGVKVRVIAMARAIRPVADFYSFCLLTKILVNERFDMIHTHCSKAGTLGRIAGRLAGVQKIYHSSHCFAFLRCGNWLTKKIYLWAERFLAQFTTAFIAVSASDADSAKQWRIFDEDQCIMVNNGLPMKKECPTNRMETISSIRSSFGLPAESFIVATACRLVEYKGVFTFLEAAAMSKSNAVFVLAGDGTLRKKIEKHIASRGLSEKVKLLGHLCDMDRLYRVCDLVVLCSDREAQPYLILEAMRANCPVVASDVAGNAELLENNRGVLVPPDPGTLAKAIDYLLGDTPKRFQLARDAYAYFCGNHQLNDQIRMLAEIYGNEPSIHERSRLGADVDTETVCSETH